MDHFSETMIANLPEEILEYIINLLSPYSDLKCSMLVCKQWHRVTLGVIKKLRIDFQKAVDHVNLEWIKAPNELKPTITERYSHSAVYYDKKLYVFGGCTSTSTTFNDLWCYDLAQRTWIRPLASGSYPSPKACASMVLFQNKLVLFGGWSHPTPYPLHQAARFYNQLHMFDTTENKWIHVNCQNLPQGKAGHAAAVIRDMMLVFGGSHGHGVSSDELWVLDLKEMIWRKVEFNGRKPVARYGHSLLVLDDYHLLLTGGCGGPNNQFSDMWLLDTSTDPWLWKEISVEGLDNAPQQLWCHATCRVGKKVIVLSKATKPPVPLPNVEPVTIKPLLTTQLAQARRAMPDTSESSSQDSSSDTDDVAQRNCRTVRLRNVVRSPHHRHTSRNSESSQERAAGSKLQFKSEGASDQQPMDVDEIVCMNCKRERDVCTCEEGFSPGTPKAGFVHDQEMSSPRYQGAAGGNNSASDMSAKIRPLSADESPGTSSGGERITPFKVPFKSSFKGGMPSVRPNANKNRQKQLEALRMYEEKFRAKMAAAGVDSKDVKIQGHNVEVVKATQKIQKPMYIHTLDVKSVITKNIVTWLPLSENCGSVPEETIFYSLDQGRGELIMFGGIQADLGSMQRGLSVDKQVVSNSVYFIKPKSLQLR